MGDAAALLDKVERTGGVGALAGRAEMDVFCGFSSANGQGGFSLSSALLARLAALGVEVIFDLYPPSSEAAAGVSRDV